MFGNGLFTGVIGVGGSDSVLIFSICACFKIYAD